MALKITFKLNRQDAKKTGHTSAVRDDLSYVMGRPIASMADMAYVSDQQILDALCARMKVLSEVLNLTDYRVIHIDSGVQVLPQLENR